jgi:hypothetical protein
MNEAVFYNILVEAGARRDVALEFTQETASVHDNLNMSSVTSSAPPNFWNALLGLMAQLPDNILADEI